MWYAQGFTDESPHHASRRVQAEESSRAVCCIHKGSSMTTIKLLFAGLIVTVMLSTPAMACKNGRASGMLQRRPTQARPLPRVILTVMLAFRHRISVHWRHLLAEETVMSATCRLYAELRRGGPDGVKERAFHLRCRKRQSNAHETHAS